MDLDISRILAFNVTDMKGGDAAQLHGLLENAPAKYASREVSLPELMADMIVDSVHLRTRPGTRQTLLDEWMSDYAYSARPEPKDQDTSDVTQIEMDYTQYNNTGQVKQILRDTDTTVG